MSVPPLLQYHRNCFADGRGLVEGAGGGGGGRLLVRMQVA